MQSIITFNEDENNEGRKDTRECNDNVNLMRKRKHSNSAEDLKGKKMKNETLKVSSTAIKNNNINSKKKKKDKHKSDMDSEQKKSSIQISDCENNQRAIFNESLDSSIDKLEEIMPSDENKDTNIELNNDKMAIKKKRKRNKVKKVKSDANTTTPELRIMSKYIIVSIFSFI